MAEPPGFADQWAYEDRLVDLDSTLGSLRELFDPDLLEHATLLNERTGERGLYALPMGRNTNHVHVWQSLLEQAGFTLADIPKEWEAFWSFWCDRVQPAVRKALGVTTSTGVALAMSLGASDTGLELDQFLLAHTPRLAAARRSGISSTRRQSATIARPGARPLHGDLHGRAARRPMPWTGPTSTTTRLSSSSGS